MNCHPGHTHNSSGVGHLPRTMYMDNVYGQYICDGVGGEGVGV